MKTIQTRDTRSLWCGACLLLLLVGLIMTAHPAWAQSTKVSGYVFGDYYWNARGHEEAEGQHGLWFRRIYLTLDHTISENWSTRLRGEMNQPGDFATKAQMEPFIKDAYLKWSNGQHQVIIGLAPTPTWERLETVWGYRSVEKTPLDFYKFGSSRDIGIAAQGKLDAEGRVEYHAMLANGGGTSSEVNEGKKAMLALAVSPVTAVTVEAYADYEDVSAGVNHYTFQGALFYQKKVGRIGLQFAHQTQTVEDADNLGFDILSVFGAVRLNERLHAFGRYDRQFQSNPRGDKIAYCPFSVEGEANFVVGGLDFAVRDQVHFMPNVEVVFYSDAVGETPATDVMPRLTFFYKF